MKFILKFLFASYVFPFVTALPCIPRELKYGIVCVCNITYCDTWNEIYPKGNTEFILVSSSKGGLRFHMINGTLTDGKIYSVEDYGDLKIQNQPSVISIDSKQKKDKKIQTVTLNIKRDTTYQTIVGFGGSFTGAVSYNLQQIPNELQDFVYQSYFSHKVGIGFNMIRFPIGGCDFDLKEWAYNELPENDINLSNFTKLDPRDDIKIKQIQRLMYRSNNYNIKFVGTAWSPPKWMKTNNKWTGFSTLKKKYYQTWADYHVRFLELMANRNLSFWAITTGNEPLNGLLFPMFIHFMSLGWNPITQGNWLSYNLGPSLKRSKVKNVKILGPDDQRYVLPSWLMTMDKFNKKAISYLDGIAVHWYWDRYTPSILLDITHALYSDKLIINTESCLGDKPFETHGPELGSWERAEHYIKAYMEDLQHWVNGMIDWNLILDEQGGPNYVKNYVDAPIILNKEKSEILKQPIFYVIGHFSKYITPNAVRIHTSTTSSHVKSVGFRQQNGAFVIVIYNDFDKDIKLEFSESSHQKVEFYIPSKSIHTLIYN